MNHNYRMSLYQCLSKNFINAIGWRTKNKYVLFESDDWGSVRMPNKVFYNYLLSKGYPIDEYYFDKYDSIESAEDLTNLFEVLSSVKDINGNHAVMTALCVVANPNFEKISQENFNSYFIESTVDTYKRSQYTQNSLIVAKQGIDRGIWIPQFHGREHIQVHRYINALRNSTKLEQECFKNKALLGFTNKDVNYFSTFAIDSLDEVSIISKYIIDGLDLFYKMYGYKPIVFCPPCGIINTRFFESLHRGGVQCLQAGQYFSPEGDGSIKHYQHFWGHRNQFGQVFTRRNCVFEPARNHNLDWVDRCMKEIEIAFRWGKPACINTHRVSYVGTIFKENRDKTLFQLKLLLSRIQKRWPDVEFISSDQLYFKMISQ